MKVLAVINQKGGVAKSTTAMAIGEGLIREGKRVLYVDLDGQGNLSFTLQASGARSVADVLCGGVRAEDAIQRSGDGLRGVLAASPALGAADAQITQTGKEYRLKEALEGLGADFDVCVIDTPPSIGILTINALTAADGIVIPAQADIFSLQGVRQLYTTISSVRKYCNPALKVLGIVITRYNQRAIISRDAAGVLENTAKELNTILFRARIRECTAIKEAQANRESIFSYAPNSNASADYLDLIAQIKEVM